MPRPPRAASRPNVPRSVSADTAPARAQGCRNAPVSVDIAAVEVKRLRRRPQPPDHRARLGEVPDRVGEVVVGQAAWPRLSPGHRQAAGRGARADAEVVSRPPETTSTVAAILASMVAWRNRLLVTRHPQACSRSVCAAQRRQQRPAFEDRPVQVMPRSAGGDRTPTCVLFDLRDRIPPLLPCTCSTSR